MTDPWRVPVRALRRTVGSTHAEHRRAPLGLLSVGDSVVTADSPVDCAVVLAAIDGGVEVSGRIVAPYAGVCRRCSQPVTGEVVAQIREVYRARTEREREQADDDETYELGVDYLDLALAARDAILLDLPVAPLCRRECRGLCDRCGADRNLAPCACSTAAFDDRWAALDALREPPGAPTGSPRS